MTEAKSVTFVLVEGKWENVATREGGIPRECPFWIRFSVDEPILFDENKRANRESKEPIDEDKFLSHLASLAIRQSGMPTSLGGWDGTRKDARELLNGMVEYLKESSPGQALEDFGIKVSSVDHGIRRISKS